MLHPLELIARLAALVPPPWFHLVRYHGVLAPHATLRPDVVPHKDGDAAVSTPSGQRWLVDLSPSHNLAPSSLPSSPKPPSRCSWAKLLARVFRLDVSVCPRCRGTMRLVAFVTDARDIDAVLSSAPRPPPRPAHVPSPSPQTAFAFAR